MAFSIACSANNFRSSSARVPAFVAFTTDWLLFVVDDPAPFITDFDGVRYRWFGEDHTYEPVSVIKAR